MNFLMYVKIVLCAFGLHPWKKWWSTDGKKWGKTCPWCQSEKVYHDPWFEGPL